MLSKFSRPASWFGKKIFSHISLQPGDVETIRECAKEGTLIYVMRYPSILDTMLLNMLLQIHSEEGATWREERERGPTPQSDNQF